MNKKDFFTEKLRTIIKAKINTKDTKTIEENKFIETLLNINNFNKLYQNLHNLSRKLLTNSKKYDNLTVMIL